MELDFKVTRLYRFNGDGATKAMCDISISDQFAVKGFRVIQGKKGLFVGMPSDPGKNGKWYDSAFPLTQEVRQALSKTILAAYEED